MSERCSACGGEPGDLRRVPGGGLRVVQLETGKDGKVRCLACIRDHAEAPPPASIEPHPGAEPATNDATPATAKPPCKACHGTGRDYSKGDADCDACKGTRREP